MHKFFEYLITEMGSDLHLSTGCVPMIRKDGDMVVIPGTNKSSAEEIMGILNSLMNESQKEYYKNELEIDFSAQIGDKTRFRINAFRTINGPAAVMREIPVNIRTLSALHAPEILRPIVTSAKGLVLVVGPTGSGKSTTLAAMIDYINETDSTHIITIEDPVEFIHTNKKSMINQREVGSSTLSFNGALRSALREDPDVILVGELRDIETVRLALTAAETGHLVLATLHTSSAAQTINRIIDVFPPEDKALARSMLSVSLRAIISQRLVKKVDGGRCAAFEIMIANSSIRNLIREDKIPQINSVIELSKKQGMCQMKDSLHELLNRGFISPETALESYDV
jgi:twitching motility protein PilT